MFDIGANKGAYTRELLKQVGNSIDRIYCFEPSKELVQSFLSFIDARVVVVNSALGSTKGTFPLYASDSDSGLGSLTKRRLDHFGIEMTKKQEVEVITLDEFAATNEVDHIDFLKLDVEGHELDVLAGAERLLSDRKIGCIQFEFGGCNIDTRTFFQDYWYLLVEGHGFHMYRISPLGAIHVNKYREMDELFITTNYIAVNQEHRYR